MNISSILPITSFTPSGALGRLSAAKAPQKTEHASGPEQAGDELQISSEAARALEESTADTETFAESEAPSEAETTAPFGLTEEEQVQVEELKARDREVRSHEQAHLAAAGSYARGGPTFTYQQGPDGNRYAIGGEVQIDTSPVPGDPAATIQKARVIRAAASAPAEPSSQDRSVASQAAQLEAQAHAELQEQQREQAAEGTSGGSAQPQFSVGRPKDGHFEEGDGETEASDVPSPATDPFLSPSTGSRLDIRT